MSKEALLEYIEALSVRYNNATKRKKSTILDEFCETTKLSRKHAIRKLGGKVPINPTKPGPKPVYDDAVIKHLVKLWQHMRRMCSKRMKAAIPLWLNYYEAPDFNEETKQKLLKISASSIDRLLKPNKEEFRKGLSATKAGAYLKSQIPIELLDGKVKSPGFTQNDTVAHCGNSLSGEFANTLTMTDLLSGWTANRAMMGKEAESVVDCVKDIRSKLPFTIRGFASDCGSEFINEILFKYCKNKKFGFIKFTRSRPYHKNDNSYVEQKNDATVRQLLGYSRIEDPEFIPLMNEIYSEYWNPYLNYFCPVLKLKQKIRIGGKLKKIYDDPKTPYQRLLDSNSLTDLQKQRLESTKSLLNPIKLKEGLDKKLEIFFRKLREKSIPKLNITDGNAA